MADTHCCQHCNSLMIKAEEHFEKHIQVIDPLLTKQVPKSSTEVALTPPSVSKLALVITPLLQLHPSTALGSSFVTCYPKPFFSLSPTPASTFTFLLQDLLTWKGYRGYLTVRHMYYTTNIHCSAFTTKVPRKTVFPQDICVFTSIHTSKPCYCSTTEINFWLVP